MKRGYPADVIARAKTRRQKKTWDTGWDAGGKQNCKQLGFARHRWTWDRAVTGAGGWDSGHEFE